jgi:UDP-glucose 4-epimerase
MKIAITGGAGYIGAYLTRAYLDAGHDVLVIDNLSRGRRQAVDTRARFYQLDIRDGELRTLLQRERPDVVSHHVAFSQQEFPFEQVLADADVHIRGTLNVLECCIHASVKKILFASGGNGLYGNAASEDLPLTEDTLLRPRQPINISAVAGEWYVRHYSHYYGLKHTILRYADVYGELDRAYMTPSAHPVNYFTSMLAERRRPVIRGSGAETRDHIFIEDVVRANLCALKQGENQTFHISSGIGHTLNQLYKIVVNVMESQIQPLYLSGPLAAPSIILDNTRARQLLNWQPTVSPEEGIQRMVALLRPTGVHPAPVATPVRESITEPISATRIAIAVGMEAQKQQ